MAGLHGVHDVAVPGDRLRVVRTETQPLRPLFSAVEQPASLRGSRHSESVAGDTPSEWQPRRLHLDHPEHVQRHARLFGGDR